MSQIVERFSAAVQLLVGDGPVKNRLMAAYSEHLEDLQQVDLPISGKRDFAELHVTLHRVSAVGTIDCVRASVQKMSPQEAWQHAQTIVRLYTQLLLMEQIARAPAEKPMKQEEDAPPRFLVSSSH
jgi:hypothetical protein